MPFTRLHSLYWEVLSLSLQTPWFSWEPCRVKKKILLFSIKWEVKKKITHLNIKQIRHYRESCENKSISALACEINELVIDI